MVEGWHPVAAVRGGGSAMFQRSTHDTASNENLCHHSDRDCFWYAYWASSRGSWRLSMASNWLAFPWLESTTSFFGCSAVWHWSFAVLRACCSVLGRRVQDPTCPHPGRSCKSHPTGMALLEAPPPCSLGLRRRLQIHRHHVFESLGKLHFDLMPEFREISLRLNR